jgi:hypothetical protein
MMNSTWKEGQKVKGKMNGNRDFFGTIVGSRWSGDRRNTIFSILLDEPIDSFGWKLSKIEIVPGQNGDTMEINEIVQMTQEEFEALAKKIFATWVRAGYVRGCDRGASQYFGCGSAEIQTESVWDQEVQWLREVTYETPMDITKIEDWDKV